MTWKTRRDKIGYRTAKGVRKNENRCERAGKEERKKKKKKNWKKKKKKKNVREKKKKKKKKIKI